MATDFRRKDQLPDITERIVATYERSGKINHLDHCPLPRYDEIVAAIHELNEIMFPGYRRARDSTRATSATTSATWSIASTIA